MICFWLIFCFLLFVFSCLVWLPWMHQPGWFFTGRHSSFAAGCTNSKHHAGPLQVTSGCSNSASSLHPATTRLRNLWSLTHKIPQRCILVPLERWAVAMSATRPSSLASSPCTKIHIFLTCDFSLIIIFLLTLIYDSIWFNHVQQRHSTERIAWLTQPSSTHTWQCGHYIQKRTQFVWRAASFVSGTVVNLCHPMPAKREAGNRQTSPNNTKYHANILPLITIRSNSYPKN